MQEANVFASIQAMLTSLDGRLTVLDQKIDAKTAALERKMDQHFRWLIGLLVMVLPSVITLGRA